MTTKYRAFGMGGKSALAWAAVWVLCAATSVTAQPVRLLVSSTSTGSILRYNGATGDFIDAFVPASSGGLDVPFGIVFGPDGNLYVSSSSNDSILRYNGATGAFIDAFVPASGGGLNEPNGLIFGPDGNLYVSSAITDSVLRYNGATGAFIDAFVPAAGGGLDGPTFLIFENDGDGDGVPDPVDVCPATPIGVPVDCAGRPLRDCNGDCLVDGGDVQCIVDELLSQ
jgi:sugar lactone lactonase YvrE